MTENEKVCTVIEDEKPCPHEYYARGMCAKHYQRWRRNGDPLVMLKSQSPPGEGLKQCSYVDPSTNEQCPGMRVGRGLCRKHYMQEVRNGTAGVVRKPGRKPTLVADRALVDKNAANGCWCWTGYKNAKGYGVVAKDGAMHLAHRVVYEELVGPIPEGMQLDHLCAVAACVNPEHLEPVTNAENIFRGGRPHLELRGTVKGGKTTQVRIGTKTL